MLKGIVLAITQVCFIVSKHLCGGVKWGELSQKAHGGSLLVLAGDGAADRQCLAQTLVEAHVDPIRLRA